MSELEINQHYLSSFRVSNPKNDQKQNQRPSIQSQLVNMIDAASQ